MKLTRLYLEAIPNAALFTVFCCFFRVLLYNILEVVFILWYMLKSFGEVECEE